MILYETKDYVLSSAVQDDKSIYQVTNKATQVTEYEDFLLSRIIDTLVEMQSRLDAAVKKYEESKALTPVLTGLPAPTLSILPRGTDNGEGGVH